MVMDGSLDCSSDIRYLCGPVRPPSAREFADGLLVPLTGEEPWRTSLLDTIRGIDEAMTRTSWWVPAALFEVDNDDDEEDGTSPMLTRRRVERAASWSRAVAAAVVGTDCSSASDAGIRRSFFVAGPSLVLFAEEFEFLATTMSAGRAMKDCPTGRRERMRFLDMILVSVEWLLVGKGVEGMELLSNSWKMTGGEHDELVHSVSPVSL